MLQKHSSVVKGRVAPLVALLALSSMGVWAQSTQGGVRGTVSDASGAAVPNVKVLLTNQGTNEIRNAITNSGGFYDFSDVVPATYSVTAESPSFKKFERTNVLIGTQEYVTVDVRLEVGAVTESVLVTEQMPLVESSNASQGQVLDNQKLVDLPNLGRNPFMMSRLAQNVVQVGPPAYNRMEDQSGSSEISIAGGPVRGNNYLLDGIPITDANNRAIIIPAIEAVQEVKIQSNTYDAEMARTGGGMFNTLMKSGTNDFHGSLYGHLRRTDWDANAFFSNAAGIPIAEQPNTTWGGSFGGRIWIPKVYDGKNKTFFFLGIEHYDDRSSDSQDFNLPTLAERAGNFSGVLNKDGSPLVITNPATGAPFANNIIPASQLNPVGLAVASFYPTPTSTPAYYGANDLALSSSIKARAVQYTSKIDEDFTSWWRASLSYLRYYSLEPGDTWFNSPATQSGWRLLRRVDATQLNNLFTINPTTVLAVRYGFNRFPNFDYNSSQGFNVGTLGMSPGYANSISPAVAEFPQINMSSIYSLGDSGDWDYYDEASHNFSVSVDKFIGKHSIKAGFDYRRLATSGSGINCTTGCYNFNSGTVGSNTYSGNDLADLLLGLPYSRQADTSSTLTDYIHYYAGFVQDNFRLSSKITVNFGLRLEHESGVEEAHNGLIVGFNQTASNPLIGTGAAEYAGVNGAPTHVGNYQGIKWGPRGGVAYQLNDKTVIRGGYGIFYAPQIALGGPIGTLGYANNTQYTGLTYAQDQGGLTNPFPSGLLAPLGNSQGAAAGIGTNFSLVDPNTKAPMIQQYSIDVQRELKGGIALEVGYVGSHSTHLTLGNPQININALNPSYLSQGAAALNAPVANPFAGNPLVGTGSLSGSTISAFRLLLPHPAYTEIEEIYGDQNHASYNSMVIKAQKRFSHGLTFLSTLTVSKNRDESSGGVGSFLNGGAQGAPQNPYNTAAEYSLSNIDTPIRWATAITYELPVGKGKPFLGNANRLVDLAIGGWSVNAVSVYETGFPLQVYQTDANSAYGYDAQRPNLTGSAIGTSGSVEARLNDYLNTAAFSLAPQATFGNAPRTVGVRGPGQKNWDLSVFKNFSITERAKAQFRAEALNAFNSPLFLAPNTNLSNGDFGVISGQANFSRQLQLAIRFTF
jgi:trimeric autotransporter adhesin